MTLTSSRWWRGCPIGLRTATSNLCRRQSIGSPADAHSLKRFRRPLSDIAKDRRQAVRVALNEHQKKKRA